MFSLSNTPTGTREATEDKFYRLEAGLSTIFCAIVDALLEGQLRTCYASNVTRLHKKIF